MPNRWVIRENVRRYREQLKTEKEPDKRRVLEKLLAEQEARLPPDQRGHEVGEDD